MVMLVYHMAVPWVAAQYCIFLRNTGLQPKDYMAKTPIRPPSTKHIIKLVSILSPILQKSEHSVN